MQPGDHLFVSKPVFGQSCRFYTHHGIYVGGQQVIHYAGYANGLSSSAQERRVSLVSLKQFCDGQPPQIRQHPLRYSRQAVVQRARSRLGEDEYSLLLRNCEHFATWCWTGEERSEQVRKAVKMACSLGVTGLAVTMGRQAIAEGARQALRYPLISATIAAAGAIGYGAYRLWDEYV